MKNKMPIINTKPNKQQRIYINMCFYMLIVLTQLLLSFSGINLFPKIEMDLRIPAAFLASGFFLYFVFTKYTKRNELEQLVPQELIESELASTAMNFGGLSLIVCVNLFLFNPINSSIVWLLIAVAAYVASWILLPKATN